MHTPHQDEFLDAIREMSDRDQKLMLACMKTFNRLPLEQRATEKLKQMLASVGFESDLPPETIVH